MFATTPRGSWIFLLLLRSNNNFIINQNVITVKNMKYRILFSTLLVMMMGDMQAQTLSVRPAHSSMYLQPTAASTTVPFDWNDAGREFVVRWGMDTAWDDEGNVRRGTNFIGKEYMSTGRISFQPSDLVGEDGELSASQKSALNSRITHIKLSGTTSVEINCDHEKLNAANYKGKPKEWYRVIKATVKYAQSKGLTVESVAPFNEPDYTAWNEGTKSDFLNICKLLKADPDLAGIRICGGNTLNCDEALPWYNALKSYLDEGNTHQLAGSFDNYANFFQTVKNDGKVATADELHNVGEAIVGVEYGMENGIWWGFDGIARGEFCKANTAGGSRLGYAEDRNSWTSAAVYRLSDGKVEGFVGSSERQANDHTYDFVSKGRDVYFDGYGPMRSFSVSMPGGTGYQNGQTNAERMVRIISGEDVPPYPIVDGQYILMNKKSKKVLQAAGSPVQAGTTLTQGVYSKSKNYQKWAIEAVDSRIGGDFGYYTLRNAGNLKLYADVLNWSVSNGGSLIAYNGTVGSNEQWVLEYADNGDYYIRSRHSGLYLQSMNTSTGTNILQYAFTGKPEQRWRILPVDASCETKAPGAPQGLAAEAQPASVALSWAANAEADMDGYLVLRGEADAEDAQWQVIGRQVKGTAFVDNTCEQGHSYLYKVKAIDRSCNISKASDEVRVELPKSSTLLAEYNMEGNPCDTTVNLMDAVAGGAVTYDAAACKEGKQSLVLNGKDAFLQLPAQVGNLDAFTIGAWVYWKNTTAQWTRIFDFGNGTDEYMFLTPSNGSRMRFVIKWDGAEQVLSAPRLLMGWHHVAVSMDEAHEAVLYVDGKQVGSKQMTCSPAMFMPGRCYVGRSQFAADPLFKGNIDDLRIYNYALSADDIQKWSSDELTGISHVDATSEATKVGEQIYSLDGVLLDNIHPGMNIIRKVDSQGNVLTRKVMKK